MYLLRPRSTITLTFTRLLSCYALLVPFSSSSFSPAKACHHHWLDNHHHHLNPRPPRWRRLIPQQGFLFLVITLWSSSRRCISSFGYVFLFYFIFYANYILQIDYVNTSYDERSGWPPSPDDQHHRSTSRTHRYYCERDGDKATRRLPRNETRPL